MAAAALPMELHGLHLSEPTECLPSTASQLTGDNSRRMSMSVLPVAMVALLTASLFAYSQSSQDAHILSVAGHSDYAKILELNGKSYVEVQDLARLTRGALTSEGNQ